MIRLRLVHTSASSPESETKSGVSAARHAHKQIRDTRNKNDSDLTGITGRTDAYHSRYTLAIAKNHGKSTGLNRTRCRPRLSLCGRHRLPSRAAAIRT